MKVGVSWFEETPTISLDLIKVLQGPKDQAEPPAQDTGEPVEPRPAGLMSALEELATNLHKIFGVACTFRCDEPVEVTVSGCGNR